MSNELTNSENDPLSGGKRQTGDGGILQRYIDGNINIRDFANELDVDVRTLRKLRSRLAADHLAASQITFARRRTNGGPAKESGAG